MKPQKRTILWVDPFMGYQSPNGYSFSQRLTVIPVQTPRKNRAIKLDIYIRAADVGDGFELRERVDKILGFFAGRSHVKG